MIDKMRSKTLFFHILGQILLWTAVKIILAWIFVSNGGPVFFFTHTDNIEFLKSIFTLNLDALLWLTIFGMIWVLILFGWRDIPPELKRFLLVVPIIFYGMFFVGYYSEVRIFNEIIPLLTAPAIFGVKKISIKIKDLLEYS